MNQWTWHYIQIGISETSCNFQVLCIAENRLKVILLRASHNAEKAKVHVSCLSSEFPILKTLLYSHVPRKQTVKTYAPIKNQTIHNALMRPENLGSAQPHHLE